MRKNKFLVVIHAVTEEQSLRNVEVAFGNGADGVFLINHDGSPVMLKQVYTAVRKEFCGAWIGLNFLRLSLESVVSYLPDDAQALWCDSVGYDENLTGGMRTVDVDLLKERLKRHSSDAKLFGGFDFKYQTPLKDLETAMADLSPFLDVITTSGPRTGHPPNVEKIDKIRTLAGPKKRIALASGMTPENVEPFLPLVDYFLVATGISHSHTELDPVRVKMMAQKLNR